MANFTEGDNFVSPLSPFFASHTDDDEGLNGGTSIRRGSSCPGGRGKNRLCGSFATCLEIFDKNSQI